MSVSAVYINECRTDVYNDQGTLIYQYGRRHEGASASGNTVLIDSSESEGCMVQIVFDDEGNAVRYTTLNPRPRW